jgi:hypothetical protein
MPMVTSTKRKRRLVDAYAFAGFRPQPTVRGIFGDPKACVIDLVRHSKKRPAAVVAEFTTVGTIGARGAFATFPAAIVACICSSRFAAFSARAVAQ